MNAAVRAVVRTALYHGMETIGVMRGFEGLMDGDCMDPGPGRRGQIIHQGGTILRTARSERFKTEAGQRAASCRWKTAVERPGGDRRDGSVPGALELEKKGLPVIGIPGTIDNDIAGTDVTIGYDTAVNAALSAVQKLRDTASSRPAVHRGGHGTGRRVPRPRGGRLHGS